MANSPDHLWFNWRSPLVFQRQKKRVRRRGVATQKLLAAVVLVVAGVGGFYSSYSSPIDRVPAALDSLPMLTLNPAPSQPRGAAASQSLGAVGQPGMAAPPSPLDFLRAGLAERPTSVAPLVEEVKLVADRLNETFPDQPDALEISGRLHFRLGDSEKAATAWQRCIQLNPDYGYAYHGLAMVANKRGDATQAAELFREALARNPERHETQIELAMVLIDANAIDEVITLLEKNVQSDPRPYRGRVLLGAAFYQRQDFEQARQNYEAAIASHPTHANAHLGLAKAYQSLAREHRGQQDSTLYQKYQGLAKEFLAKHEELLASEREIAKQQRHDFDDLETMCIDVAGTYFEAATICFARGVLTDAEVLSLRASVLDPTNVKCRQALAFIYLRINQPAETIRVLEELTTIETDDPGYPIEIARLHVELGRMQLAEQTLRRICDAIGAANVVAVAQAAAEQAAAPAQYVVLSFVNELNGDQTAAVAAIDKAIELAPDRTDFADRRAALTGP